MTTARTLFLVLILGILLCKVAAEDHTQTRQLGTNKKWYPGHYTMQAADSLDTNSKAFTALTGPDADLFQGVFTYKTWVTMEPWYHAWNWTSVYTLLDALPAGKKLLISLSIQAWTEEIIAPFGSPPGPGQYLSPCPQDMHGVQNPYDGGWRYNRNNTPFSTVHMPATMNRFLEFVEAFAQEFDADERLALVLTQEIPYDATVRTQNPPWGWNNQYDGDTFADNLMLMAQKWPNFFNRTISIGLGAYWPASGGNAARLEWATTWLNSSAGLGIPDCVAETYSEYNSNFRPSFLANAGKWPVAMGIEFADMLTETDCDYFQEIGDSREAACRAGTYDSGWKGMRPWPKSNLDAGLLSKCHFYWWNTAERGNQFPRAPSGKGGEGFLTNLVPFLRNNTGYGLTTAIPENILVNITSSSSTTTSAGGSSSSSSSSASSPASLLTTFKEYLLNF